MKTIKMIVELTYDDDMMHGQERESIYWFENDILFQKADGEELTLHSNEIGDTVGTIKVLKVLI